MMRGVACEGDTTDSGGRLTEGTSLMHVEGRRAAFEGAQAYCPIHGATVIAEGTARLSVEGRRLAREGDRLACGHRIVIDGSRRLHSTEGERDTPAACSRAVPAKAPASYLRRRNDETLRNATTVPGSQGTPAVAPVRDPVRATERRCVLRIGVFFDGTNNNAGNIQAFDQCSASSAQAQGQDAQERQAIAEHCKPYMTDSRGSYGNGITNVWRLYQLYRDSTEDSLVEDATEYFMRVYVPGIGTSTGHPDNMLGMGLGIGETGILARVADVLTQTIPEKVHAFSEDNATAAIEAVEVDVFGFSRGAAAARHFVHEINRGPDSPLMRPLLGSGARLAAGFDAHRDLRVGFVGLFDTVVSRASLADGLNVRGGHHGPVKVALPAGCARQVVHLVARDEHRANFMLTTVQPDHREIPLPGVHSDVGGSYHDDHEGPLMLIKPLRSVEAIVEQHGRQYMPAIEQTDAWRRAHAQRASWLARLGDSDAQTVTVDAWQRMETAPRRPGNVGETRQPVTYATLRLERPLDWRYQLIPLRVMHRLAQEAGVEFKPVPSDANYQLPKELLAIGDKLIMQRPLNQDEEALLARTYLHQSAHWNLTDYARMNLEGFFYVQRPDPSGRRVMLPNENR